MSLKDRVHEIVTPYSDNRSLECDGMTRVISFLLDLHDIPHKTHLGKIVVADGRSFEPHFWIVLDETGEIVDYRSRLWFEGDTSIPEGVFEPGAGGVVYNGMPVEMAATRTIFHILTGDIV